MSRLDSASQQPRGTRRRRPSLIWLVFIVLGLACVALALAGIVESKPGALAYGSAAGAELSAHYLETVYRLTPASAEDATSERAPTDPPAPQPERHPAKGAKFGTLTVPALGRTVPIIEGTDAAQLKQGVGHFVRSALPGEENNCVLSGHRDTVFTGLGKVGIGDLLIVNTSAGEFTYLVLQVRIVGKDDKTVIVPTDHAVLTVTTCYPFYYVGAAPDRYVLVADLLYRR